MKSPILLLVALASASLSFAAVAQSATTAAPAASSARPAHQGMRVDANGDGVVTRDEAAKFPRLAASFDQIDANKDSKLSQDEMQAWRSQHRGNTGDMPNRRGDRMAMTPEMQARMAERRNACFDKADANHDGQLSRDEFSRMHEVCGSMMGGRGGHRGMAGNGASAAPPQAPAR